MQSIKTNAQLDNLVKTGEPFVLNFSADWGGPCQMLEPILIKLDKEYSGKVKILKINIDEAIELAEKFSVQGIPSVYFLKGNVVNFGFKGVMDESEIRKKIQRLLEILNNTNPIKQVIINQLI